MIRPPVSEVRPRFCRLEARRVIVRFNLHYPVSISKTGSIIQSKESCHLERAKKKLALASSAASTSSTDVGLSPYDPRFPQSSSLLALERRVSILPRVIVKQSQSVPLLYDARCHGSISRLLASAVSRCDRNDGSGLENSRESEGDSAGARQEKPSPSPEKPLRRCLLRVITELSAINTVFSLP